MISLLKEHQEISPGMLLAKGSFLSDLDLRFTDAKESSADIAFQCILWLSYDANLISKIDEISALFLDFSLSGSQDSKLWNLLMSSSVYTLRCLSSTESNIIRSETVD